MRLFANILAGHLLILFMGGGLVVLLGLAALGVLTLPWRSSSSSSRSCLIAGLQAFIFATLTSIYLGEATSPRVTDEEDDPMEDLAYRSLSRPGAAADADGLSRSRSASAPASARSARASASGYIFGKVIESVTRQPEMREEITSIQWLGFALTEAIVFYAFIFGLIAFFL